MLCVLQKVHNERVLIINKTGKNVQTNQDSAMYNMILRSYYYYYPTDELDWQDE